MSYYAGDYYSGGYYAGGHYSGGSIFSFLGRVGKGIVGAATGFLTGGPVGALRGAATAVSEHELEAAGPRGLTDKELTALHARDTRLKAAGRKLPALPGAPPGMALVPAGGMAMVGPGGMLMRGYRLNKSTYITRGGGTSRWPVGLQVHPKHTEPVKSRRMNVANPRALRRALRRAHGFAKLARRYITVTKRFKRKGVRRVRR